MPQPLSDGERLERVLRDKKLRRDVLDREIAALEDMARMYEKTENLQTWGLPQPRRGKGV